MEPNVSYTLVGAFMLVLMTAVVLGVIWLSSGFSFEHYSYYMVYMQESVSGLSIDSPVEFNGVGVGTVSKIELNREDPHLVEVLIKIKNNTPVTEGTTATLNTRGVTGFTYIALKDLSNDLRPLTAKLGELYPAIKTTPSLFMRLDAVLTQLSKNMQQISESIKSVLDKDNQLSIKTTLFNLQQVTGTLQSQTLPMTYHVLNKLDDMSQAMTEMTNELKHNPTILIRGVSHSKLGPGETMEPGETR